MNTNVITGVTELECRGYVYVITAHVLQCQKGITV